MPQKEIEAVDPEALKRTVEYFEFCSSESLIDSKDAVVIDSVGSSSFRAIKQRIENGANLIYCPSIVDKIDPDEKPKTVVLTTECGKPWMEVRDNPVTWNNTSSSVRVLEKDFVDDGLYVQDGIQVLLNNEPVQFTVEGNSVKLNDSPIEGTIKVKYQYDEAAFYHKESKRPSWNSKPTKIGGVKASKEKRKAAKAARKRNRRK